uniref:Uncharacterized protein n=1 Tax=Chromera velia CCMP2878 TaxID=1169474 RepID=A0A0G4GR15_9ALVE|eukprot:Cvel_5072.t1-p1 / transcript=Cvel_5072.t1 / gene=Cvel_5072 / organism=Chromera_velia_CCMP2878 / gene_product=hypothetical protein / transcript_product=hypothetical protein / location=Cvel_scaffold231:41918-42526(+) / protein_length=203 / sequence_SO=supercontig / SO=protein_coding / is_pseudo=false
MDVDCILFCTTRTAAYQLCFSTVDEIPSLCTASVRRVSAGLNFCFPASLTAVHDLDLKMKAACFPLLLALCLYRAPITAGVVISREEKQGNWVTTQAQDEISTSFLGQSRQRSTDQEESTDNDPTNEESGVSVKSVKDSVKEADVNSSVFKKFFGEGCTLLTDEELSLFEEAMNDVEVFFFILNEHPVKGLPCNRRNKRGSLT